MLSSSEKKNKKILCISSMQNWDGGEEFLYNLSKNLSSYQFIMLSPVGEAKNKFEDSGLEVIELNGIQKFYPSKSKWRIREQIKLIRNVFFTSLKIVSIQKKIKSI